MLILLTLKKKKLQKNSLIQTNMFVLAIFEYFELVEFQKKTKSKYSNKIMNFSQKSL
jgi:hypothetical protein